MNVAASKGVIPLSTLTMLSPGPPAGLQQSAVKPPLTIPELDDPAFVKVRIPRRWGATASVCSTKSLMVKRGIRPRWCFVGRVVMSALDDVSEGAWWSECTLWCFRCRVVVECLALSAFGPRARG
jgi:hypothetical protein